MKILLLNGSPKKKKSDTMHITRAFLDGMKETAAQEIHPINVTDRHIEFCRGCFACKYNGGHCVLKGLMSSRRNSLSRTAAQARLQAGAIP